MESGRSVNVKNYYYEWQIEERVEGLTSVPQASVHRSVWTNGLRISDIPSLYQKANCNTSLHVVNQPDLKGSSVRLYRLEPMLAEPLLWDSLATDCWLVDATRAAPVN